MKRGTGYVNNARGFTNTFPDGVKLGAEDVKARLVCYNSAKITPAKKESSIGRIIADSQEQ
jgi:hypothetical protein